MGRTPQDEQPSVLADQEQYRVQAPDLKLLKSEWKKAEDAMKDNNDASNWEAADMFTALAARIRRGELVADKAVVVVYDDEEQSLTTCSAKTGSTLETFGILGLALSNG